MAETAQTLMPMDNLDPLADDNVSKDGEEGEHRGHRRLAVYHEERHMVDLEAVCEVADAGAAFVGMRDDYDLVAAVYEFLQAISIVL